MEGERGKRSTLAGPELAALGLNFAIGDAYDAMTDRNFSVVQSDKTWSPERVEGAGVARTGVGLPDNDDALDGDEEDDLDSLPEPTANGGLSFATAGGVAVGCAVSAVLAPPSDDLTTTIAFRGCKFTAVGWRGAGRACGGGTDALRLE